MKYTGVVFDFNGTLYWDTEIQEQSWDRFLHSRGFELSEKEKHDYIHGINAKDTFEYLLKRECSAEEVYELTEEKEVIYRQMCLDSGMEWAPGAVDFIKFLIQNNVQIAIATASAKNNVEFFIEQLDLLKYFDRERIIYNDGTSRGKPHPDLFNKAIEKLGVPAEQVAIFEDSLAGVEAAKRSGAGQVYIVNGKKELFSSFEYPIIFNYRQVEREIFSD